MATCSYCRRSGILIRTNSHGLCKRCREEIRTKTEEEREKVKGDLIAARFLKDPKQKVWHLRRALEGNNRLLRYEKLGCTGTNPSPKALKSFLEDELRESEPFGTADGRIPQNLEAGSSRPPGTRAVRRHPAMFEVWVDRTTAALTEDISSRGLCVRAPVMLKPGTRVGVTLEVPGGDVAGYGMVRWAHRTEDAGDGSTEAVIGLEFLAPPPELQRYR